MTEDIIKGFYTAQVRQEWRRLVKDSYHRIEFATTLHFLQQYLPTQGHILDAGGGPGRYTIEMAQRGYDVTLLDFTPANLIYAGRRIKKAGCQERVKAVMEGSICDLSRFPDSSFDALICTGGPLSHVLEKSDRGKAISELVRVVKPGAPIFVSVMGRLSVLALELDFAHEIEMAHFKPLRDTGDYFGGSGFTACHFYLPEELQADFARPDLEFLQLAGLEGLSARLSKQIKQLARNDLRFNIWLETHYQTCTHPSVVGMSEHILIICRKHV
jgi:SAM-dependent methyltransferase